MKLDTCPVCLRRRALHPFAQGGVFVRKCLECGIYGRGETTPAERRAFEASIKDKVVVTNLVPRRERA